MQEREKLPGIYEKRYKSEKLKREIADIGMWGLIPAVKGTMDSPEGIRRIQENDPLFSFIDKYLPDVPYAFEPNMRDGRFVLLPDEVSHQGMGVCAATIDPGQLEVCHFWYPDEFTEKSIPYDQFYIPLLDTPPCKALVDMI